MSIVVWKVLESQVASEEQDVLYRRLEARLERVARESEVPVGAYWENAPGDSHAGQTVAVASAPPPDADVMLLASPADASVGVPVLEQEREPQEVRVEPGVTSPAAAVRRSVGPKPTAATRDLGPRATRVVARPRDAAAAVPPKAVALRPAQVSRPVASARRTTVRTAHSS